MAGAKRAAPQSVRLDLSRLTPGERLWLWRRSVASAAKSRRGVAVLSTFRETELPVSSSQMEAGLLLGVDTSVYWAAENDLVPESEALALLAKVEEPPYLLKDALRVARRRSSLTLPEVAIGAGVGSRPTFYKLERAGDRRVVAFWQRQGFKFTRELLRR